MTLTLRIRPDASGLSCQLRRANDERLTHLTARGRDPIDEAAAEIHRVLARAWQHEGGNRQDVADLHDAAQQLAAATLGEPIRGLLSEVADDTLRLELAPDLLHVPWELLRIGEASLAERFAVGRVLPPPTDAGVPDTSPTRERGTEWPTSPDGPPSLALRVTVPSTPLAPPATVPPPSLALRASVAPIRLLIWANPQFNLLHAEQECARLRQLVQRHASQRIDVAVNRRNLSSTELLAEMARCDWLHFAGHAVPQGGQRGWLTADGVLLGEDLLRADQFWPRLIIAQACASAQPPRESRVGLVEALVRRGVRHYLGVWSPLPDHRGEDFVGCFYERLLDGQPIGLALRGALRRVADEFRWTDLERANYVLYGEPHECPLPALPSPSASPAQDAASAGAAPSPPRVLRDPAELRGLAYPVTCCVCGRTLRSHLLADHAVLDGDRVEMTCRYCVGQPFQAVPTARKAPPTGIQPSAVEPNAPTRRCVQDFWRRWQRSLAGFDRLCDPATGLELAVRWEAVADAPPRPCGIQQILDRRVWRLLAGHREPLTMIVQVLASGGSENRPLNAADLDDWIVRLVTPPAATTIVGWDSVPTRSGQSPELPLTVVAAVSGWTPDAVERVSAMASPTPLVLIDLATHQAYYSRSDPRIVPLAALFDLEDEHERVARVIQHVESRLPLEVSLAADQVAQQLQVPTASVVTAFRLLAERHGLDLDQVEPFGWVLSQDT